MIATAVVLVVVASLGAWLLLRDTSEAASSSTATVSRQTIEQTVSADGTLVARKSSDESFVVSGTVTKVLVKEGDRVKKGDALARLDDTSLVATRRAAVTSLDAAYTQLDEDEDNGASDVQLAADQAAIVAARASLTDARDAVADATLRASITGTVTSVGIGKGDVAGTTSSLGGADSSSTGSSQLPSSSDTGSGDSSSTAAISIVSTNVFVVDATVAAEDVDQLKKGLQAEITATGVDDTIYGTVSEVGLVAETNDSGAAVFPVTIQVTGKQKDLYAGVSATASIVVKQVPDVLTVATNALSTEDGTTYVTKLTGAKKVKTEVETGQTYGMTTEVTSGLEEGDEVVVEGFTIPGGGGGDRQEGGFPGGGELPDISQLPSGGQLQAPGGGQ